MSIAAFNIYEKVSTFNADVRRKLNEIIDAVNAGGGGASSGTLVVGGLNSANLNTLQPSIGGLTSGDI